MPNATLSPPRPIAELVEEAVARLTVEQLHALAARRAAAESRPPEPERRPFDVDTGFALDADRTITHLVDLYRQLGIDDDLIASRILYPALMARLPEAEALAAITRATGWRPRSREDRHRSAAKALLADGFTPRQIATALREVEAVAC